MNSDRVSPFPWFSRPESAATELGSVVHDRVKSVRAQDEVLLEIVVENNRCIKLLGKADLNFNTTATASSFVLDPNFN